MKERPSTRDSAYRDHVPSNIVAKVDIRSGRRRYSHGRHQIPSSYTVLSLEPPNAEDRQCAISNINYLTSSFSRLLRPEYTSRSTLQSSPMAFLLPMAYRGRRVMGDNRSRLCDHAEATVSKESPPTSENTNAFAIRPACA